MEGGGGKGEGGQRGGVKGEGVHNINALGMGEQIVERDVGYQ